MPDVEVKLNFMADYKAAMAAISQMGKALEIVQSRAKQILPLANAPQGGGDDTKLMVERKEAVTQLALAMRAAAQTGELMAAALAKLNPVLAEMGPEAEQVQNVAEMGRYYKELAASLGVAAEAAARYKAADGGMKETDERIKRLMDENQKLMDLVSNIREEYTESVRRNAEREKERILREDNAAALEKEKQKNFDNTYQMKLASMTKRELVAEIRRLTAARKEAAKAGDEFNYQQYGEHLRIARQELRKTTQAQQVNKIAFLQQAQVAQQMGANLKTITEGVMGFGKALDEGTVNLTGMASAAISMGMAIKAGLGPLGWALAAVEGLTLLWNAYAKNQKEAAKEAADFARSAADANKELLETQNRLKDWKHDTFRADEARAYAEAIERQNDAYKAQLELIDQATAADLRRIAMTAGDKEREIALEKLELQRQKMTGEVDEYEYDLKLLDIDSRLQDVRSASKIEQAAIKKAQAKQQADAAAAQLAAISQEESGFDAFLFSPEEIGREVARYTKYMGRVERYEGKFKERDALEEQLNKARAQYHEYVTSGRNTAVGRTAFEDIIKGLESEIGELNEILNEVDGEYNVAQAIKQEILPENFRDAETPEEMKAALALYASRYKDAKTRDEDINRRYKEAQRNLQQSNKSLDEASSNLVNIRRDEDTDAVHRARVRSAQTINIQIRRDKAQERERQAAEAKAAREAERAAREANKMKQLGRDVFVEAEAEGAFGKLTGGTRKFLRDGGMGMLRDRKISEREGERLAELLETARRLQLESLEKLVNEVVNMARDFGQTSDKVLGRLQAEQNKSKKKTKRTID